VRAKCCIQGIVGLSLVGLSLGLYMSLITHSRFVEHLIGVCHVYALYNIGCETIIFREALLSDFSRFVACYWFTNVI
jgi:hypothetical protein